MKKAVLIYAHIAIAAGILLAPIQLRAQTPKPDMDHTTAAQIIVGCLAYAKDNDIKISIAVFDASASLKGFTRMDGAHNASVNISQWKGHTAASFNKATTADIAGWAANNPGLAFAPGVATLEGGVPALLRKDGAQLGGVGVSGAAPAQDAACARAGIKAAGLEAP